LLQIDLSAETYSHNTGRDPVFVCEIGAGDFLWWRATVDALWVNATNKLLLFESIDAQIPGSQLHWC